MEDDGTVEFAVHTKDKSQLSALRKSRRKEHNANCARNALAGEVKTVTKGAVNAEVALVLQGGEINNINTTAAPTLWSGKSGKKAFATGRPEVMIMEASENARPLARNILSEK